MTIDTPTKDLLRQTALKAPLTSGVYLWHDKAGSVIYVGKAKNLKNRLSSYFLPHKDIKTRMLVSHATSIEYITTANEYEAFLLENTLIKKHNPKYNINLKDGKTYPMLCITIKEKFPRLLKTRQHTPDGSLYFGPYPDVTALDAFLDAIKRLYPLRHCKHFKNKPSPCLYYHIKACCGPCCNKITTQTYTLYIEEIRQLLEGKNDIKDKILQEMKQAAALKDFEKAIRLRDGLCALNMLQQKSIVEDFDTDSRDYIAYFSREALTSFIVLRMRGGRLVSRQIYRTKSLSLEQELLSEFIIAFYADDTQVPPYIYVDNASDLVHATHYLQQKAQEHSSVQIIAISPDMQSYTRHKAALDMAKENAREDIIRWQRERGDNPALQELFTFLHLPKVPHRIEGFDIAHLAGKMPVASLVSFYNGNSDKSNYRYFRLRTTDGKIDDFASMKEAVARRYTRLVNEGLPLPDLILIDGGIGQVNAVSSILNTLGVNVPIVGLAKRDEELYLPHNSTPLHLPRRSPALRLLQRVRDETHRFATSKNQELRTKENTANPFMQLAGIGKVRACKLNKTFPDFSSMISANASDIAELLHISKEKTLSIIAQATKLEQEQKLRQASLRATLNDTEDETIATLASSALKDI